MIKFIKNAPHKENMNVQRATSKKKMSLLGLIVMVMCVISLGIFMQSCTEYEQQEVVESMSEQGMILWKQQLESGMKNHASLLKKNGLIIKDFIYREKINSSDIESVKSILLSNPIIPVYNDTFDAFTLVSLPESDKEKFESILEQIIVPLLGHEDIGIVDIECEYNGETINTICIVSDKQGIIYNSILTNLVVSTQVKTGIDTMSIVKNIPRLKAQTETTQQPGNYNVDFVHFDITTRNWYLDINVYIMINTRIYYNVNQNRIISINSHAPYSCATAYNGWRAQAKIETKSYQYGTEGNVYIVWGYTFGYNMCGTLSYNGGSISLSGGSGSGATGEDNITTSRLR
jgi:hypothetical protein